jgi:hypothetical protein
MPAPLPVEELRAAYAEWSEHKGKEFGKFLALFAEDAEIGSVLERYLPAPVPQLRGPDAVRAFASALTENCEIVSHETERTVSQGRTIVWIGDCTMRNIATETEFSTRLIGIWQFNDAGKAISFYEMGDSFAFIDAAQPKPPGT